jgi:hypothetical protein
VRACVRACVCACVCVCKFHTLTNGTQMTFRTKLEGEGGGGGRNGNGQGNKLGLARTTQTPLMAV